MWLTANCSAIIELVNFHYMNPQEESSDLLGQRQQRIDKLNQLKKLGISPYPSSSRRNTDIKKVVDEFETLNGQSVIVAGRIKNIRSHGKLKFLDIADDSNKIQIYIKFDEIVVTQLTETRSLSFEELDLLDSGDFIEVSGEVTRTQRGEMSILAKEVVMLTKILRPIPAVLEDKEERFRRRYLDMVVNPEVKERIRRRALFWDAHRDFFTDRNFYEVSIPVLEHIPGGGDAVPFMTHMNAIDEDFFLRISHELPLKRLIGGGFEKVFDVGARFRNEGLSDEHLPEHVAMEFYWAYANWEDGMKLIKELFDYIFDRVYGGKRVFTIRGFEVDFSKEWELIDFNEIFQKTYGVKDIYTITLEEVKELLTKNGISFERTINIPRGVDALWKKIRKNIGGPAFLINHPKYLSPLQKPSAENPNMVERCQIIIAGTELGNGWTEVNDPIDQYNRFMEQQALRDSGDDEAQWLDIDYVEMLEYGMPPTFGWGHSERVFWFLEDVTAREGVPFPQLKMSYDDITRKVYPELNFDELEANRTKLE